MTTTKQNDFDLALNGKLPCPRCRKPKGILVTQSLIATESQAGEQTPFENVMSFGCSWCGHRWSIRSEERP